MTASTRFDPSAGSRLRLVTLGDAALCLSLPGIGPERVLEMGKPLALLTYLACSRGRSAAREHLTDLLWSHMGRDHAQNALRQTIWQIKTRVGHDILTATRERVSLVESVTVDRDALLAASDAGDINKVVELYKGDFLIGFAAPGGADFEHFADVERQSLRRLFVRSAEEVVHQRLASGRAREAFALARRARDLDRWNQRAWRQVLECLIAAGDVVAAHVEAEALAQLLADEEIEPEVATREAMRDARTAAAKSPAGRPTDSPTALIAELIGREGEFAALMRGWNEAARSQTTHFHVTAPAGYGKTRFLIDVQNRLRAMGGRAVYLRADFGARDIAYSFASDVAARLATMRGAGGISPSSAGTLVALNPSLSSSLSAERDIAVDDEALRRRSIAIRELVTTIADEHPLAILVDDLHWADPLSFRTLDAAIGGIEKSPLLVVWAGRPAADNGRNPSRATTLALAPLRTDDIAALVSSLADLSVEAWAVRLPHALYEATGGSPLLVLETLQLLIEQSLLVRSNGRWVTDDADALFHTLAQGSSLRRRVASLDSREGSILLLLAVSGMSLDEEVLGEAAGRPTDQLAQSIAVLEQRGMVSRQGDIISVVHDEHATAAIDAASRDAIRDAAVAVGRALLRRASNDAQRLCVAGSLLARGGDAQLPLLSTAFELFVRTARLAGDRRADSVLARELLGASATDRHERMLVRKLPWLVRARLVSRARIAATMAIATGALLGAGGVLMAINRPVSRPDALLAAARTSSDGKFVELFPIQLDGSHWAGISVLNVRVSTRPRWRTKLTPGLGSGGLRPDGQGWAAGVPMPDSGVIDIVELDLDGKVRRLTYARGDDYQPSWAPDNSRFVFVTMRWSRHGHYDLAIYDAIAKNVHQLTQGNDTDWEPAWSPDGSRIAFIRQYAVSGERGLCVIDADGSHLRCLPPEPSAVLGLARWSDAHRVLLRRTIGTTHQLARFNLETDVTDLVDERGALADISPDGRFALCRCPRQGYPPDTYIVYPLDRPNEFAVLRVEGGDASSIAFHWAPSTHRLPFVSRLSISAGLGPPIVGALHQLHAFGIDTTGGTVEPGVVRWRSEDTSVATIDSMGRLMSYRSGRVTIEALAGGWRSVRMALTITDPAVRVLVDETWTRDFAPVWQPFGVPKPELTANATFGHAFVNNGDGSFFSGAYTSKAFDTRGGLWAEAELSTPITASESQEQLVSFIAMDSAAWAGWDRITADGPSGVSSPGWAIRYPQGIGGTHFGEQMLISSPTGSRFFTVPPSYRTGRPFRLVMQIFPDGHCGVALDGKVIWRGPADFFEPAVHLMLAGNSVDTKVLVGHLRVATGIAPGIAWEHDAVRAR